MSNSAGSKLMASTDSFTTIPEIILKEKHPNFLYNSGYFILDIYSISRPKVFANFFISLYKK
jgi:hypothetical protein